MNRRTLLAATAALTFAISGCGVGTSGVISGLPAPSGRVQPPGAVTLYLLSGTGPVAVERAVDGGLAPGGVLGLLAAGPNAHERASGLRSAVPAGAAPFRVASGPADQITVTTAAPPDQLPAEAITQIVDTVCATSVGGRAGAPGPVVLLGRGQAVGPRSCPGPGRPSPPPLPPSHPVSRPDQPPGNR